MTGNNLYYRNKPGIKIRHKGIELGVVTDAPFIGARLNAIDCHHNCPGCFNQHLREEMYVEEYAVEIILRIKQHGLSEGIILGGLEWTEQPLEMLELIRCALRFDLKVMLYTHHSVDYILDFFPELYGKAVYVKCGEYREDLKGYMNKTYDVRLASTNQKIYNLGCIR